VLLVCVCVYVCYDEIKSLCSISTGLNRFFFLLLIQLVTFWTEMFSHRWPEKLTVFCTTLVHLWTSVIERGFWQVHCGVFICDSLDRSHQANFDVRLRISFSVKTRFASSITRCCIRLKHSRQPYNICTQCPQASIW